MHDVDGFVRTKILPVEKADDELGVLGGCEGDDGMRWEHANVGARDCMGSMKRQRLALEGQERYGRSSLHRHSKRSDEPPQLQLANIVR